MIAVACVACGCDLRFDLDQPISLVVPTSWNANDVGVVAAAARCWELQFGVPFVVGAKDADQQVRIEYSDLACISDDAKGGQFSPGIPAEIDLCPPEIVQPRVFRRLGPWARNDVLFIVLAHELGHASGILREAKDPYSVMGAGLQLEYLIQLPSDLRPTDRAAFAGEDRSLFEDANGRRTGACAGDVVAYYPPGDSSLACGCRVTCDPDPFEPNSFGADTQLDSVGSWDLDMCNDESDNFVLSIAAHVRIENNPCNLTFTQYRGTLVVGLSELDVQPGEEFWIQTRDLGSCPYRLVVE